MRRRREGVWTPSPRLLLEGEGTDCQRAGVSNKPSTLRGNQAWPTSPDWRPRLIGACDLQAHGRLYCWYLRNHLGSASARLEGLSRPAKAGRMALEMIQELASATPEDIAQVELGPRGAALHWERLDVDFSLAGLLAGIFGKHAGRTSRRRRRLHTASHPDAAQDTQQAR